MLLNRRATRAAVSIAPEAVRIATLGAYSRSDAGAKQARPVHDDQTSQIIEEGA